MMKKILGKNYIVDEYLIDKIESVPTKEDNLAAYKQYSEIKANIIIDGLLSRKQNLEKYLQFADIVKNEPYFRMEHILALDLPHDVLIFLSEKNIGKSYGMIQECNKIINSGGLIALGRVLEEDIKCGMQEHVNSYGAAFEMDGQGRLWVKDTEVDDLGEPIKKKRKKRAGICMSITGGAKWKGGGFENYRGMIIDEATDLRKEATYQKFLQFFVSVLNSIERRKEFFLTILGNTDYKAGHPLFQVFQIDPEENLIYVKRKLPGALKETKILYINSRGLYPEGAKSSKFIGAIGDPHAAMSAFMNSARMSTKKVISLDLTCITSPHLCLAFTLGDITYHLKVSEFHYKPKSNDIPDEDPVDEYGYFFLVEEFSPMYLYGYTVQTSEVLLYSKYQDIVGYKKSLIHEGQRIGRIVKSGKCFFIGELTSEVLNKVLEKEAESRNTLGR